jgi:hypothetical protein
MHGLLLIIALAVARAVSLHVGTLAECFHDRKAAFQSIQDGTGSIWIFHVTHNAGTSLQGLISKHVPMGATPYHLQGQNFTLEPGRYYYDNLIGERGLGSFPLKEQVPCDSNKFVSIFPVRNPLPRILTYDGSWTTTATENTDKCNTDNYGLRKLLGKSSQDPINGTDIEFAKRRLESFDIVLDVATYKESAGAMCKALGFSECVLPHMNSHHHAAFSEDDILEKVGPELFAKWKQRNAPELEVYQHAQKLAADFVARYQGARALDSQEQEQVQEKADDQFAHGRWLC